MTPRIGYALREQNRGLLDDPAIDAVEFTFERADDPLRSQRYLADAEFPYVSVHALKLSVASPDPPARAYLAGLREIAIENDASAVSDHLGFTRDCYSGIDLGHFAPPPYTLPSLETVCRNIDAVMRYLGDLPFYLENIAYDFIWRGTMSEAEYLSRVLSRTGCGWLLDITNVYANAVNHGYDARAFIEEVVPFASRMQIHLAGGFFDPTSQMYVDSHSEPIPAEVWQLYGFALERAGERIDSVFIERDDNFPTEQGWRDEVRQARRIAEGIEVST